jgi:hypothetical protein
MGRLILLVSYVAFIKKRKWLYVESKTMMSMIDIHIMLMNILIFLRREQSGYWLTSPQLGLLCSFRLVHKQSALHRQRKTAVGIYFVCSLLTNNL